MAAVSAFLVTDQADPKAQYLIPLTPLIPLLSRAAPLTFFAATNSLLLASPSANRSATSTAFRKHSSVNCKSHNWRQQAHPNSRSFRSVDFPHKNCSIPWGSVQVNHSTSVMSTPAMLLEFGSGHSYRPLPKSGYRIGIERRIRTDNRNPLDNGRSDHQAVEGIFVIRRKRESGYSCRVLRLNGQNLEAVPVNAVRDERLVGHGQGILADTDLDRHFPVARRADQNLV